MGLKTKFYFLSFWFIKVNLREKLSKQSFKEHFSIHSAWRPRTKYSSKIRKADDVRVIILFERMVEPYMQVIFRTVLLIVHWMHCDTQGKKELIRVAFNCKHNWRLGFSKEFKRVRHQTPIQFLWKLSAKLCYITKLECTSLEISPKCFPQSQSAFYFRLY